MLSYKVSLILVIFIACLYYGETSIVKRAANDTMGSSGSNGSNGGMGSGGDSSSGGSSSSSSSSSGKTSTLDSALGLIPLLGPLIVGILGIPKGILQMVVDTL